MRGKELIEHWKASWGSGEGATFAKEHGRGCRLILLTTKPGG